MRASVIITILMLTTILSCKKKDDDSNTGNVVTFSINGISDVKMRADSTGYLSLEVKHELGAQDKVKLSVTGLPSKVTASFSPEAGIPTYASVLTLTATADADTGSYPVKITGTTDAGASRSYDVKMTVLKKYDCMDDIIGDYTGTGCSGATTITRDAYDLTKIYFNLGTDSVHGFVNCDAKTIYVPYQVSGGSDDISGNGTISGNKILFDFYIAGGHLCPAELTKK